RMEETTYCQGESLSSLDIQKLEAQARKIHMLQRILGIKSQMHNWSKINNRHRLGRDGYSDTSVRHGQAEDTWHVTSSDATEGSELVTYIVGTDVQCDCIDYPFDYVCIECKICIHMYKCTCREDNEFPAIICKHVHAVILYGEGIIQKSDIQKHCKTPHRTPGHKVPHSMIFRFDNVGVRRGSKRTLVPVSSASIKVDIDKSSRLSFSKLAEQERNRLKSGLITEQKVIFDHSLYMDLEEENIDECIPSSKKAKYEEPEKKVIRHESAKYEISKKSVMKYESAKNGMPEKQVIRHESAKYKMPEKSVMKYESAKYEMPEKQVIKHEPESIIPECVIIVKLDNDS
ncbi:unnamed protein product, partial [Meganyctiphanes norvegica]